MTDYDGLQLESISGHVTSLQSAILGTRPLFNFLWSLNYKSGLQDYKFSLV